MKKVIMVTSMLAMTFMTAFTNDSIARGCEHPKPAPRIVHTPPPTVKVKLVVARPKVVVVVKSKPVYYPKHRPACENKHYAHKHDHKDYSKYACNYSHR